MIHRRQFLQGGLGAPVLATGFAAGLGLLPTARAQALAPRARLKLLVPANPGGGWDQTAKAVAATLQATRLVEQVELEHKPGKGGVPGLAHFVDKYSGDADTLMIGGLVMCGAIALHRAPVDLTQVQPVAKLTTDTLVIAVPRESALTSGKALVEAMRSRPQTLSFGGGSAGGVDHMLLGMIARAIGVDAATLKYVPSSAGADFARALKQGALSAGIAGYSELKDGIADGSLRALAVSSARGLFSVPSLREQGIATELGNWRGLFAAPGAPREAVEGWGQLLQKMAGTTEWKAQLERHNWRAAPLYGAAFRHFVDYEQTSARVVIHLLKMQA
ncbi:tripartite tricarboxylate transporter substrate binding protein [Aquincola sp. S2]|uniref:Tripartite tricarboxylate transporter substrate binding protein n=1 Tax=Pseudaquabacterium terrae TaxID=2732868 RepID=A0ABX2EM75_9BURK|nr:tripartite tricarboxylate transporter substrate-binding protein [Aquabacterium terrae]NRF69698.1 tripartite tricarboxylate transporter substrate binding protein [Aquabacterium terrae]